MCAMGHRLRWLICACLACASVAGSSWDEVIDILKSADSDGWTLVAGRADCSQQPQLTYEGRNSTGADVPVPVASAAKWVSGVIIMRLVQEGVLSLDDTVQKFIHSWTVNATDGRDKVTLRTLLTFTSGITEPVAPCKAWLASGQRAAPDSFAPLADCVTRIADATPKLLSAPVGSVFSYQGVNLEIAGAMAEIAANQSWSTLFAQAVQSKLRSPARYTQPQGGSFGPVEGGLIISPADYGRFLRLALQPNAGLLNATTLRAMWNTTNTAGLSCTGAFLKLGCDSGWQYGTAMWLESDGSYGSSLGANGVYPRADVRNGSYAVLVPGGIMLREPSAAGGNKLLNASVTHMRRIWPLLMQALDDNVAHHVHNSLPPRSTESAAKAAMAAQRVELTDNTTRLNQVRVEATVHGDYAEFVRSKPSVDVKNSSAVVNIHAFCDSFFSAVPPALLRSNVAPQWLAPGLLHQVGIGPHLWVKMKRAQAVALSLCCPTANVSDPITAAQINAALHAADHEQTLVFAPDIVATKSGPEWLGLSIGAIKLANGSVSVQSTSLVTPLQGLPPPMTGMVYLKLLAPEACTTV